MTANNSKSFWFIFYKDNILLEKRNGKHTIPNEYDSLIPTLPNVIVHEVASLDGIVCKTLSLDHPVEESDQYVMMGLRASYDYIEEKLYNMVGKAAEILHWDKNSRYCPACGIKTIQTTPICKQCPQCKQEYYPAIATAIIVLIRKDDSILLVHARNFRGTFHGLVAGFLETGETLEECVKREVMEETGLTINNITYFGNQPWPYPSGLMVGFTADYVSGEIKLQDEELSSGAFYTKDNLPELPRKLSMARRLIDHWLETQQ